jgi:hypothetical protein
MARILLCSLEDIVDCPEQSSIRASLKTVAKSLDRVATGFSEDPHLNTTEPTEYTTLDAKQYSNGLSSNLIK